MEKINKVLFVALFMLPLIFCFGQNSDYDTLLISKQKVEVHITSETGKGIYDGHFELYGQFSDVGVQLQSCSYVINMEGDRAFAVEFVRGLKSIYLGFSSPAFSGGTFNYSCDNVTINIVDFKPKENLPGWFIYNDADRHIKISYDSENERFFLDQFPILCSNGKGLKGYIKFIY